MSKVYSKALDDHIDVERIIGRSSGNSSGPCLIFLAGIHGNEPSGIIALQRVFEFLNRLQGSIRGQVYGIAGNLWALERGERFHSIDLNRLWTRERIEKLESGTFEPQTIDEKEQLAIHLVITKIIEEETGPFYFFDLHTTSSKTIPFITVNDSLLNRKFTSMYPLISILGIEEYIEGPVLSYINELGYVSFGFEGGQHDTLEAVENHTRFAMLSMVFAGVLREDQIPLEDYLAQWKSLKSNHYTFYEIVHRYEINPDESFTMNPGFANFQKVKKGELLARNEVGAVKAERTGLIFMPLYQSKGNDGYFILKPTSKFFLRLSAVLRQFKLDRLFPLLPGISWSSRTKDTMIVDLRIARFLARPMFHLFGYRSLLADDTHLHIRNREHRSRHDDYKYERWYRF